MPFVSPPPGGGHRTHVFHFPRSAGQDLKPEEEWAWLSTSLTQPKGLPPSPGAIPTAWEVVFQALDSPAHWASGHF